MTQEETNAAIALAVKEALEKAKSGMEAEANLAVSKLESKNQELLGKLKDANEKAAPFEGINADPEKIKELLSKSSILDILPQGASEKEVRDTAIMIKALRASDDRAIDPDKGLEPIVSALAEKAYEAKVAKIQEETEALKASKTKSEERAEKAELDLRNYKVTTKIQQAVMDAGCPAQNVNDVVTLIKLQSSWDDERDRLVFKDGNGEIKVTADMEKYKQPMDEIEFVGEFKKEKGMYFGVTTGNEKINGGDPADNTQKEANPFKTGNFLEQNRLMKSDPTKARQLKAEADKAEDLKAQEEAAKQAAA